MRILTIFLVTLILASPVLAERRTEQTQRAAPVGDGIEVAPLMTLSWEPAPKEGETELIQVAVTDRDGNPVTVEFYVNGLLKFKQSVPPYGVSIGPDIAKPPYTVTVIADDDYGNKSRANILIRQTGVSSSYSCVLDGENLKVSESDLTPEESGATGFSVLFSGNNSENTEDSSEKVDVNLAFTTAGSIATGTVSYIREDQDAQTVAVSGSVTFKSDGITVLSVDLKDKDGKFSVNCN